MKISVEVCDFGDIVVSSSVDNPNCVRLELKDMFGEDGDRHFDLNRNELDELIEVLILIRGRRREE